MPTTDYIDNNIFNTDEVEKSIFDINEYTHNIIENALSNVLNCSHINYDKIERTNKYADIEQFIENENNEPQIILSIPQLDTLEARKIHYLIDKDLLNNYSDSSFISNFYSIVCGLENTQETEQLISYYHSKINTPKSINEVKTIISLYKNSTEFISKGVIYLENKIKKEQLTKYKTYRNFVKDTEQQERNASEKRKKALKQKEKDDIEQKRLEQKIQKEEQEKAEKALKEQEKAKKQKAEQEKQQKEQQEKEQQKQTKEQQKKELDEKNRLQKEKDKEAKELKKLQEQQDKEKQKIQEKVDKKLQKEAELEEELVNKIVCKTDLDVANDVITHFGDDILYIKGKVYLKKNNIYVENERQVAIELGNFITNSEYVVVNNDAINYKWRNHHYTQEAVKMTLLKIKEKNNDNIYNNFHTTTKQKLCFLDGVYVLNEQKFYKWDEITFEYYSTIQIDYNFLDVVDDVEVQDNIKNALFEPLFNENTDLFLQMISRMLGGHIEDKLWSSYTGNRGCGKGVFYDAIKNVFKGYIAPIPTNNLLKSQNAHTNTISSSREMYWLLALEFVRLGICQETPKEGSKLVFNSKLIKSICSGGDEHTARKNYDVVDTTFKTDVSLLSLGNQYTEGDENDIDEKRVQFSSSIQFESQAEIDLKYNEFLETTTEEQAKKIIKQKYRVEIPNLKDIVLTPQNRDAILMLIIKNYKTTKIVNTTKPIVDNEEVNVSLMTDILKTFDLTYKPTDFILKSELKESLNHPIKKIDIELKGLSIVSTKSKKKETRDKLIYTGIKFKESYILSLNKDADN